MAALCSINAAYPLMVRMVAFLSGLPIVPKIDYIPLSCSVCTIRVNNRAEYKGHENNQVKIMGDAMTNLGLFTE